MFDTHSHVQYDKFDEDRIEVLQRAKDAGIKMICVGTDYEMSVKAIELATVHETIWAAVGLHPNDISIKGQVLSIKGFEDLLGHPKVVAIGEVGLDYYRTPELEKQELQREVLSQFIDIASRYDKPLIIHCRNPVKSQGDNGASAHLDLLNILNSKFLLPNSNLRGVIHSFTGSWADAEKYLKLGFYIGLNGIITFPPSRKATEGHGASDYNEVVENIPLDRILLETDAPFLTPIPHRGKRNEPSYVKFVAEKVARIKKISTEEVEKTTDQNAEKLFGL